jgi:hypothetical protein
VTVALSFSRQFNILLASFSGIFSSEDIADGDAAALAFVAAHGAIHAILDFGGVEAVAVPASKLILRAQQPWASPTTRHIIVVPQASFRALARTFVMQQRQSGLATTELAASLEEALGLLGAVDPVFETVDTR